MFGNNNTNCVLSGFILSATFLSVQALAQVTPPAAAPPISGATSATVNDVKVYTINWGTNWPHVCRWMVSGAAQIIGSDDDCDRVSVRFVREGPASVDQVGSAQSGTTAGGTVYWPDVTPKGITVSLPPPRPGELVRLTRTVGPYVIKSSVMRNGAVVGAERAVTATESQIVNNTGGVTPTAPRNVKYVCSPIVDRPTGAFPVSSGSNRIRKCKGL